MSKSWCNERVSSHSRNCPARPWPALHVAVTISCLEWLRCIVSPTRLGTRRGTLSHGPALWWGRQRLATAGCGFQGQAGQDRLGGGRARGCCCWCLLGAKRQVLYLGRGRGPSRGTSAELRLNSSDGGRGREDELRGQRNRGPRLLATCTKLPSWVWNHRERGTFYLPSVG